MITGNPKTLLLQTGNAAGGSREDNWVGGVGNPLPVPWGCGHRC